MPSYRSATQRLGSKSSSSASDASFHGIEVGAAVPLVRLDQFCKMHVVKTNVAIAPHHKRTFAAIRRMLKWFASVQIRNVASLGGNLATASPIGDMNPLLTAMGAKVELALENENSVSRRIVPLKEFFVSYRRVALAPTEVIVRVLIPLAKEHEFIFPFKQARRREDDISIVTAGMRVNLVPGDKDWHVDDISLVYGGMAATIKVPEATQQALRTAKTWNLTNVKAACNVLAVELALPVTVPGGMSAYRTTLSVSFLYKFYLEVVEALGRANPQDALWLSLDDRERSGAQSYMTVHRPPSSGLQRFGIEKGGLMTSKLEPSGSGTAVRAPVGHPLMHRSAYGQVSGEAKYVDDMDDVNHVLHGALVLSTVPHGDIVRIDASKALKMPGVVAFLDASVFNLDTFGHNELGPVIHDEECFASNRVVTVGQPLGIVLAATHQQATAAADVGVHVEYNTLPSLVSIDEAISAQSFHTKGHTLVRGNVEAAFAASDVVVEGQIYIGGQEHFYLETNVSYCIPMEDGAMHVTSSTQAVAKTQACVAQCLGIPAHKVVACVKRMGGGFGGKETRSVFVACAAAVAAKALKRPVRLLVERSVDMLTSGTRHPYFAKYKAGATKDGKLLAYDVELFNNAGYSLDLSEAVMDRALFHCENAYFVPNVRAVGKCCKTNLPTNTAFRGFGAPQGMMVGETMIEHLASTLQMQAKDVREINLYKANMRTHFGQVLTDFHLDALWARALRESRYDERLAKVETFNRQNKWKKQGLSILPSKFGISFTNKFMNQGGSLVHVYSDGSVLVSHGGTEMGQGLHTKVIQIVAKAFGISCDDVTIHDTSTDKVANSQPSAASMSTDLYGMATLDACEQILERLKPVVAKLGPNATFAQVTRAAYFDRICLSAHGFFIVPGENCGYDWSKSVDENSATGQAFNYFTTGVCVTQVELDVLTGDTHMQTVDIYMDIGASINPAIDIGQIEGAFIQGFGLFCMEQHVWGDANHPWIPRGAFFTRGPGTYKIPAFNDVPLQFNVWLEPNMKNKLAVHSSKAIGEPPLFLGATAYFAIKAAIDAARLEHIGEDGGRSFQMLPSPLTPERARLAVQDALCVTTPIPYGCY
ncbi:xanthine dehydrogenase, molybdopterin binding subunit, variant [Aphanomyces invadans]|uniref:Xanthine dehydrogenase, molybdopterin binding subunit, variant n=1 Tax=Aphanomyces invadans TaxID=157072 RepID=A0A024UAY3_9STRA|nr:xanthine dehydrogenase, molybdopterin binding subunit, variant [Aphanomyces invadans]ETW03581.1 xanthine dehydrogenase, molybdopterin binding subunit, variant [Aphanomyces invadans]|eukprot:XP_008867810.1 xanthine dehydrogenase, molybdopterin binding subunit, variant [Aphanomyces invadans]